MDIIRNDGTNEYTVISEEGPLAAFRIIENRYTDSKELEWHFGIDAVPLEILSEIMNLPYMEE